MKRYIIILVAIALIPVFVSSTKATMIDLGDGLIYDDDLGITWLQNANYSGGTMTWDNAVRWAAELAYQGYDNWRLPTSDTTCSGSNCTESEMGHLYYDEGITSDDPGLFIDVMPYMYWSGTEYDEDEAWRFSFKYGTQGLSDKDAMRYAWAVHDGELNPIPEPSTLLLLGSGLVGLAGLRRKLKEKLKKGNYLAS